MEFRRTRYFSVPQASLFVTLILLSLLSLLFLDCGNWLSTSLENSMKSLQSCVNPDLPKNEFVQNLLIHLPTSVLLRHRLALFNEACIHSLVWPEYVNFPLVGQRDTAFKPVAHKLSENIWTIISCIRNKTTISRTLFKNGKCSKTFLSQASQRDISISDNATSLPTMSPSEHVSPPSVSSRPDLHTQILLNQAVLLTFLFHVN